LSAVFLPGISVTSRSKNQTEIPAGLLLKPSCSRGNQRKSEGCTKAEEEQIIVRLSFHPNSI